MALIGKEIVQSRKYIDPNTPIEDKLNHVNTYPKTVLEAVKVDMDHVEDDDTNLKDIIDEIRSEIYQRQMCVPAKSPNFLMTYAGVPGGIGSIQISNKIPWDPNKQSHDKIPTEKAVGDLLYKMGLLDSDGNIIEPNNIIRWSDIIGRPSIYEGLGQNEDGFMTQKAVTDAISGLQSSIEGLDSEWVGKINSSLKLLSDHIANKDNPHDIDIAQIGAASAEAFAEHIAAVNPHGLTKADIDLGNVDNTSDIDKPISKATQDALDILTGLINDLQDETDDMNYIIDASYDRASGKLSLTYRNGSIVNLFIPINGLVDEISFDKDTNELVVLELSGEKKKVDLSTLFIRYIGSIQTHITIEIDGSQTSGEQIIKAIINPESITDKELADDAIITRVLANSAVTGDKIKNLTITTKKLADYSVTKDKIGLKAVTNTRIDDRAVDGRTLFSSKKNNRILATLEHGEDPVWTQVISPMIADEGIETINIKRLAITSDRINDYAVITEKIADSALTTEKIKDLAVTIDKIANRTIDGTKLIENIELPGLPTISTRPAENDDSNKIPDTRWVNNHVSDAVFVNKNFANRSVDGRVLFSSDVKNRALVVYGAKTDPVWGLINNDMMDVDSIKTKNVKDLAITDPKIADKAIFTRHLNNDIIKYNHISESAVLLDKIYPSENKNMILAVKKENGHPEYTRINNEMMEENSVTGKNIVNLSIPTGKLESDITGYKVLGVMVGTTAPQWVTIVNRMLGSRSVDGRVLFSSGTNNCILATKTAGDNPVWTKIDNTMLVDRLITKRFIEEGAIYEEHLQEKIIEGRHIKPHVIDTDHMIPRSVTADILFTSRYPNKVLAVFDPYSNPVWANITGEMLADESVHKEKFFRSDVPNRVLGVTRAGRPPEYIMIDSRFIVDNSINPAKLMPNFILNGTPQLTSEPLPDSDSFHLANTAWVRRTITSMAERFTAGMLKGSIHGNAIIDYTVDPSKLIKSLHGNRVLGVLADGESPQYTQVVEGMIQNGAVTNNKLQRDLMLLGSPTIEVRPADDAVENGEGMLIPDCKWVEDRIKAAGGFGTIIQPKPEDEITQYTYDDLINIWDGFPLPDDYVEYLSGRGMGMISEREVHDLWDNGTLPIESGHDPVNFSIINEVETQDIWYHGIIPDEDDDGGYNVPSAEILPGSITSSKIQDRAVLATKLFTTPHDNRVLAVEEGNTNPKYTLINTEMINDRAITGLKMFSSTIAERILAVLNPGENPIWTTITHNMLGKNIIKNDNIVDNAISGKKLANKSVTREKIADEPFVDSALLLDNTVTRQKIVDHAVSRDKIQDHCIDSSALNSDLVLKGNTIVDQDKITEYETRKVRNTILSPKVPSGGCNGDIWFRFA